MKKIIKTAIVIFAPRFLSVGISILTLFQFFFSEVSTLQKSLLFLSVYVVFSLLIYGYECSCKLSNIICLKNNPFEKSDFTVTVPIYPQEMFWGNVDMVTQKEARLKRDIITRLEKAKKKYKHLPRSKSYDDDDDKSILNEIHIGSPIANNQTATMIDYFNKSKIFKYYVPVYVAEEHKNIKSKSVEINGLRLYFSDSGKSFQVIKVSGDKKIDLIKMGEEKAYEAYVQGLDCGDSFQIYGKVTITVKGLGEINTEAVADKEVAARYSESFDKNKIVELAENDIITIKCKGSKEWLFKIGEESFPCDDDKDYAVLVKRKIEKKYVHLLFGAHIEGTELAVDYLLKYYRQDKHLSKEDEYFKVIHLKKKTSATTNNNDRPVFEYDHDNGVIKGKNKNYAQDVFSY